MNRTRRQHLIDCALIVAIIVPITLTFLAATLVCEIHSARVEFANSNAQWRLESTRRIEKLFWKVDTGLETFAALRLDMGTMITKLRAQVKQSSDESTQSAKKDTQVSTAAVTQAIYATQDAVKPAVDIVIPDKPAVPEAPPVIDSPDATVMAPVVEEQAEKLPAPAHTTEVRKKRSWYSHIWRWR